MMRVPAFDMLRPSGSRFCRKGGLFGSLSKHACQAGVLLVAACSNRAAEAPKVAEGPEHVACALGPGTGFSLSCAIERSRDADGTYRMLVRHPDGGFRRLEVGKDNAIVTSDGAEPAAVRLDGETAEVAVGEDRYRIPLERRRDAAQP
jgi:hypothetical protein